MNDEQRDALARIVGGVLDNAHEAPDGQYIEEVYGIDQSVVEDALASLKGEVSLPLPWNLTPDRLVPEPDPPHRAGHPSGAAVLLALVRRAADGEMGADGGEDETLARILKGAVALMAAAPVCPVGTALETAMVWEFG